MADKETKSGQQEQAEKMAHGEQLRLRWQEGGGPPVTLPGREGFGSRLIEHGLAQNLNGEVHLAYEPAGVVCEIVTPISQAVEAIAGGGSA